MSNAFGYCIYLSHEGHHLIPGFNRGQQTPPRALANLVLKTQERTDIFPISHEVRIEARSHPKLDCRFGLHVSPTFPPKWRLGRIKK